MSSTESDKPKKKFSPEDIAKLKALKAEASATKNDIADLKAYVMEMEGQFKQQTNAIVVAVKQAQGGNQPQQTTGNES